MVLGSGAPLAATGSRFALAAPHQAATEAGRAAFAAGGNSLDAALAAAATLTVVYPHNCSVGGDLFALVHRPDGAVVAVNASGGAPHALDPDSVRRMAARMPERGPLTVTVPGAVAGWETLAGLGARFGLHRALAPAVGFARDGVAVSPSLSASLAEERELLAADEGLSSVFMPAGRPLGTAETLVQPALARTLESIVADGPRALYEGRLGERLTDTLNRAGSPMSAEDLAAHATEVTTPLAGSYRDAEVLVAPPNSQGFVLLEILAAVERLGADPDPTGPDAPLLAEVFRLASSDRDHHLADPRWSPVPLDGLLAKPNIERICAAARGRVRATRADRAADAASRRPSGDTVALVAADAEGWAVSLIQSTFYSFGAGILDPGSGVIFHNRGAGFSLDPSSPNVLAGGKRPAHTLMPVLVRRDGAPIAVSGTRGGGAQPQINAQSLLRVLDLGLDPGAALRGPRWVVGGMEVDAASEVIHAEARVPAPVVRSFEGNGFTILPLASFDDRVGHAQLIRIGRDGRLEAAADPRADGAAAAS